MWWVNGTDSQDSSNRGTDPCSRRDQKCSPGIRHSPPARRKRQLLFVSLLCSLAKALCWKCSCPSSLPLFLPLLLRGEERLTLLLTGRARQKGKCGTGRKKETHVGGNSPSIVHWFGCVAHHLNTHHAQTQVFLPFTFTLYEVRTELIAPQSLCINHVNGTHGNLQANQAPKIIHSTYSYRS